MRMAGLAGVVVGRICFNSSSGHAGRDDEESNLKDSDYLSTCGSNQKNWYSRESFFVFANLCATKILS